MAVDWSDDEKWREEVVKEQQKCCDLFGTPMWREFDPSNHGNLKREIGFALFGAPEEEPSANLNESTGYTDKKLKQINKIFDTIEKCTQHNENPKNICVSFLFMFGKKRNKCIKVPVIRFPQFDTVFKQHISLFIDSCGRVYKNWQDYLENNKIPECVLCYPINGVYSAVNGTVDVEFGFSPAGRRGSKVLKVLDIGGTVLNVGAAGALIVAHMALPVAAGAAAVSVLTGAYGAGRNIQTLVDRDQHQQSIGLDNAESRKCWFGIGGAVMGIVSAGTVAAAAKNVQADAQMSLTGKIAIQSVAVSSCVLNGLAVTNGIAYIIDKVRNEEEVTALDVFQVTSAVLFLTHSVISAHLARSLINSIGKNCSGGSSDGIKAFMNSISKACNSARVVTCGITPTVSNTAVAGFSILSVCNVVGRKLIEIAKSLLRGLTRMCNCLLEVGELLRQYWESWKKEMDEVADKLCQAFGVKHWSELVIKGCKLIDSGHIKAIAGNLIAERRALVDCGSTAMPNHQGQAISDKSAVVGTNDGPNSVVDGETQNYYDEITNIFKKSVDRQTCRNPEDVRRFMTFVCKFVKSQVQEKMSDYNKSWEMVKHYNPDVNIEDFKKQYGISGSTNNHFLQNVFNEFKKEEQDAFTLLQLTYEKQNADTSAQEEQNEQGFLDSDAVRFYPFYSMSGLASNGMLSKQQYREMAAKLMGQRADTDNICLSASGDTAVIQVNAAAGVIMVQCWPEDGKVSGIVAVASDTELQQTAVTKSVVPNC